MEALALVDTGDGCRIKDGQRTGVKQITSRNVEDGGVKMEQDAFVEARVNK